MGGVNLIDFLKQLETRSVADSLDAYRAALAKAEEERHARFADLGVPADASCPASLVYHRESRYGWDTELPMSGEEGSVLARTPDYKRYPESSRVALPPDVPPLEAPLADVLRARRSHKTFSGTPIRLDELSTLLAAGAGVTSRGSVARRAAPSAGALYPVEIYPCICSVDGVPPGLYHYAPLEHVLEHVSPRGWDELRPALDDGFAGATPAAAFVLAARFPRVQAKYGERGYRFALMESGHIAQNLLLAATALGLHAIPAGGFFDAGVNVLLGIDGLTEAAVYVIPVGKP